ncbi:hypothetical protein [Actinokineospora terrae]|uniref:hypothetical protein n=1 Tax=Actinokineospora terrae TaxID=155974 RepID=UPI000B80A8F3|nr:hypothetical protein [Actinokineospora terrae]
MAVCGSTKTDDGEPCVAPVSRRGKRCRAHTWLGLLFAKPAPPVVPRQTTRAPRTPMRAATRTEGVRIATEQWQAIVAARARLAIPPDTWQALTGSDASSTCTRFAQLAATDDAATRAQAPGPVALQVTRHLAQRHRDLGTDDLLPRSLHVLGVYLCATEARDLGDCRCLRDLIDDHGLAEAKRILQAAMSDLAATGPTR